MTLVCRIPKVLWLLVGVIPMVITADTTCGPRMPACNGCLNPQKCGPPCSGPSCLYPAPTSNTPIEQIVRSELGSAGIGVNHPFGCGFLSGTATGDTALRWCDVQGSCTSVSTFTDALINSLILFKGEYGSLQIRGGSECGHGDSNTAPCTHAHGCKVDITDPTQGLNALESFIKAHFSDLNNNGVPASGGSNPCRNPVGPNYGTPISQGGPCFTFEPSPPHVDVAFPTSAATRLIVDSTVGTGKGVVTSSTGPNNIIILCASGVQEGCSATLTRGIKVTLTAVPDPNSIFAGWTGLDSDDSSNSLAATIMVNMDKTIQAEFEDRSDPPDDSGCWSPTATGWHWTCRTHPPPGGGPRPSKGCWQWDPQTLSWVATPCGGGCVTASGQLAPQRAAHLVAGTSGGLNFGSCNPTGTNVEIIVSGDPNDKAGSQGVGQSQYIAGATLSDTQSRSATKKPHRLQLVGSRLAIHWMQSMMI